MCHGTVMSPKLETAYKAVVAILIALAFALLLGIVLNV